MPALPRAILVAVMAATCAGCLRDIPKGDPFVLWGTEVFHRRCAKRIATSAGTKQKLEIQRLKTELEHAAIEARDARADYRNLEDTTAERLRRVAALETRMGSLDASVEAYKNRLARDHANNVRLEEANSALITERRVLRDEIAAARADIARLQTAALARATDDLPAPVAKDTRDDTEIRFSLLEIDPP